MTDPHQSTALTANLAAVLPIGIPLGWSPDQNAKGFLVRRAGRFCYLDDDAYRLWASAFCGPDPNAMVRHIAEASHRDPDAVTAELAQLIQLKLLIELKGDWRDDWLRIVALRVIPRAATVAWDEETGFRMLVAGGKLELRLDRIYHSVWAYWDGINTIEASVDGAIESTGQARRTLRERAHSLLVACLRAGAVFIDCAPSSGPSS